MSRNQKRYGVVIPVGEKFKVLVIDSNRKPSQNEIRTCLAFETKHELEAIYNRNSGWRTVQGLNRETDKVTNEFKKAVRAVNNNDYIIKAMERN